MNSLRTLSVLVLAGLLAACGQSEDVPTSSGGGSSGHSAANQGYKKANKKAKLDDLENADLQAIQDVFAASNISNMEVRQNAKNWSYKAGFEPSCSAYQSFYNSQRLLYADIAPKIQALKLQTVLGKELVATLAPALEKIAVGLGRLRHSRICEKTRARRRANGRSQPRLRQSHRAIQRCD